MKYSYPNLFTQPRPQHSPHPQQQRLLFLPLLLLSTLLLLHSCNGDIFVDKIRFPLTEATLNGDGDTLTLRFNTSEWQLSHVHEGGTITSFPTFSGTLYTLDGTNMGTTSCTLFDNGRIIVDCHPYELTLIRPNGRELQILLGDNPTKEPFTFTLSISDKDYFQQEGICLTQQPGSGYLIDHIEYDPTPKDVRTEVREDCYLIDGNWTDEPETRTYNLSERMRRWFNLSCGTELNLIPTNGDTYPNILVPSPDISQGVKLGTDSINYFRYGSTMLFMDVEPPFLRTVTLQPGYTDIMRIAEYQVYSAAYTLHLRNAKTGKPRTLQGRIESTTPTKALAFYLRHHENKGQGDESTRVQEDEGTR